MQLILPAAGKASRMRGLPKFLLPCTNEYLTLIERHINFLIDSVENIWIPTSPQYVNLLSSLIEENKKINIVPVSSNTMSETVKVTMTNINKNKYTLIMPDTYFSDDKTYEKIISADTNHFANLICWKTRPSQEGKLGEVSFSNNGKLEAIIDKPEKRVYQHSWGAVTFTSDLYNFIDPQEPHIGYAIKSAAQQNNINCIEVKGDYYDCGTPDEYIELIKKIF
jgi:UTP-glucose-1-phosphate uridylyltransferase